MKLLLLSLLLLTADTRHIPMVIEPVACNIDYESLRDSMPLCQCEGIEIPACQMSVHYCNVFKTFKQMSCREVR
jgi:hypothetical protein